MGKKCFSCGTELGWKDKYVGGKRLQIIAKAAAYHDELFEKMKVNDVLCISCSIELDKRHAVEIWKYNQEVQTPEQFEKEINKPSNIHWVEIARQKISMNEGQSDVYNQESQAGTISKLETQVEGTDNVTSATKLRGIISNHTASYKEQWDKNGIVQFKNERIAILQRAWGMQVQFIVAYDQLTKEGYELKAIDEGKTGGQASGGFTGGVNSYYYFQKKEYLK